MRRVQIGYASECPRFESGRQPLRAGGAAASLPHAGHRKHVPVRDNSIPKDGVAILALDGSGAVLQRKAVN
jgi:hypothetical protein